MSDQTIDCELRKPASAEEWQRYHDIRRRSLFDRRLPDIVYDPDHPDELRRENHPLSLIRDGRVVGTIRIDELDARRACFRLVAIDEPMRGQGLGAELLRRAEDFAVTKLGRREIVLFAAREAFGFYLKHGYAPVASWGETPLDRHSVPVGKRIGQARG
ncbi:MAG: GNAT family N-acetyltransferase [Alphaproteobacteria bacterium]|nr:GNAT family N-acetyltransferase [Alphaproteobacteria bacterium]